MKQPEEMTLDEAVNEFDSLDRYFLSCKAIGQGINSKESIRFLLCADRIHELDPGNVTNAFSVYEETNPHVLSIIYRNRIEACKQARTVAV